MLVLQLACEQDVDKRGEDWLAGWHWTARKYDTCVVRLVGTHVTQSRGRCVDGPTPRGTSSSHVKVFTSR